MRRLTLALAPLFLLVATIGPASAADDLLSGQRLTLKSARNGTDKLVFSSHDPGLVVPAPGSADDPRTTGARFELFLAGGGQLIWTLPAQGAVPGSTATPNPPAVRYANRKPVNGQVGSLRLSNDGRRGALGVTLTTVAFPSPVSRVGVRLTMGADGAGGCACLPEGSTGCSVVADPQCGGDCPDGLTCNSIYYHLGFTYCQCMSGGCGPGGAPCPPGTRCTVGPPGFPSPRCESF